MGQVDSIPPSKLITGLIFKDDRFKTQALDLLACNFGAIDYLSPELKFNFTDYYYKEFGRPLKRLFISFKKPACEDCLRDIKIYTNGLEKKFTLRDKRRINIDPGFLSPGKLVLATTKDYNHRIYIGKGVFAEVTLYYKKDSFQFWPWSYPDYQSREYLEIFNTIRKIYLTQIKDAGQPQLSKSI